MEFNSLSFVAFLLLLLLLLRLPLNWTARKSVLLVSSYLFYAAWNPPFIVLLWISTACDWFLAKAISKSEDESKRKLYVFLSLLVNLGLLVYFKYAQLLTNTLSDLIGLAGGSYDAPDLGIILPIGISFYTFQTLSYTIDVYRGSMKVGRSFLDYALYVTFFPQLVAGPIVRASVFLPQCVEEKRVSSEMFFSGLTLLVLGVFSKMVIADSFVAPIVNEVYAAAPKVGVLEAWGGTLGFLVQMFFDFSGYSLAAIGVARCLGFYLPDNFHYPFAAKGFADFWRRWHISLSTWIRDYLYRSLALTIKRRLARLPDKKMKRVSPYGTLLTVTITMFLMGLWHGDSWTMAIYGLLHGLFLSVDVAVSKRYKRRAWAKKAWVTPAVIVVTFVVSGCSTVLFRAQDLAQAHNVFGALFSTSTSLLVTKELPLMVLFVIIATTVIVHTLGRRGRFEDHWARLPSGIRIVLIAFMLFGIATVDAEKASFIYFQF